MDKRKIIPYNPRLKALARDLRNNSTKSEVFLWLKLKNKQMYGYDFHRQKPIGSYILDFFCHELMLGIEIDGYSHELEEVQYKDEKKARRMNGLGIEVLRFTDQQVFRDMFNVLLVIEDYIRRYEERHTPNPSQEGNKPGGVQKRHTHNFSQGEKENDCGIGVAKLKHTPNPSQEGNASCPKEENSSFRGISHNSPFEKSIPHNSLLGRSNTPNSPLETCAEPSRSRDRGCAKKDNHPPTNTYAR